MRVYGIWCNKQKGWYTNGKNFLVGVPRTWSLRANAQKCIDDLNYWQKRYGYNYTSYDLRLVELDLVPVDSSHLV